MAKLFADRLQILETKLNEIHSTESIDERLKQVEQKMEALDAKITQICDSKNNLPRFFWQNLKKVVLLQQGKQLKPFKRRKKDKNDLESEQRVHEPRRDERAPRQTPA